MSAGTLSVEITGAHGGPTVAAGVRRKMTAVLGRLTVKPVRAQVTFFDDDGPKGGPAVRCAVTVRLPYRPSIRVEQSATTARLAFDGAFQALDRQLERYRTQGRDLQRRPKKYYAAKRLQS
jgi:ribosome-associated translation inhibitor RaiA